MLTRIVLLCLSMLALAGCAAERIYADDATLAAVSYRDSGPPSLTLFTMVNNRTGSGGHTGLMINASQRVLFDPAGSFKHHSVPERLDVLYGMTPAAVRAYKSAHARSTYHVVSQTILVTPEQAELALQLARRAGPVPGAFCTSATVDLLRQIPGLQSIRSTMYPVRLMEDFARLPGVQTDKYYEDDDPDLQKAIRDQNLKKLSLEG